MRASALAIAQAELAKLQRLGDSDERTRAAVRGLRLTVAELAAEPDAPPGIVRCNGEHQSEMFIVPGEACPLCAALAASKEP